MKILKYKINVADIATFTLGDSMQKSIDSLYKYYRMSDISKDKLSQKLGISKYKLSKLFLNVEVGLTNKEWQNINKFLNEKLKI